MARGKAKAKAKPWLLPAMAQGKAKAKATAKHRLQPAMAQGKAKAKTKATTTLQKALKAAAPTAYNNKTRSGVDCGPVAAPSLARTYEIEMAARRAQGRWWNAYVEAGKIIPS